jgi:hypothetical protein
MTILSWARKENKGGKVIKKNQFTKMTNRPSEDYGDLERFVKN